MDDKREQQKILESLYSKRNIHTVLHNAIRYELDKVLLDWTLASYIRINAWINESYYESKNKRLEILKQQIDAQGMEDLVVAIAAAVLHTGTTQTIQQATGYLQAYMDFENPFHRAVTAAELLAVCADTGDFYYIQRNGYSPATLHVEHWPVLDQYLEDSFVWINNTLFNLPMKAPPKIVRNNNNCGYLTIREPLVLGDFTQHDEYLNYPAINALNKIEWILDKDVLAENEVPSKPLKDAQAHQNFMQLAQESQFVYRLLDQDPFWLCWQYDSRGRMYCHGYHVNFQGAEYKRALLSFNHYEVLTS